MLKIAKRTIAQLLAMMRRRLSAIYYNLIMTRSIYVQQLLTKYNVISIIYYRHDPLLTRS